MAIPASVPYEVNYLVVEDGNGNPWAEIPVEWIEWFNLLQALLVTDITELTDGSTTTLHKHTHNVQAGLQGGTAAEYYHLTSSEYTGTGTGDFVRETSPTITGPTTDVIHFTTTGVAALAGDVLWNEGDGTLDLLLKGGNVTLQVGQEQVQRVFNGNGVNFVDGHVVQIIGAQGNRVDVTLARADAESTSVNTLGMATEHILIGDEGYVTVQGTVRGINTTVDSDGNTTTEGAIVYLSPFTAGGWTVVKPASPNHLVTVGWIIRRHAAVGQIFVKVDNGYAIGELHDVSAAAPNDNDALLWNSTTSIWEPRAITGADVLLPANTGTAHTLTDLNNYGHSAGILFTADFNALVVASGTAGSVDVAAFTCYFRTSASPTAELKYYSIAAATVAIPTNTTRYIIASYNSGTPTITASAVDSTDGYVTFTLAFVENIGGVVHMIVPVQDRFNDHSHTMIQRMWESMGVERVSGAVLGQPANLKVSVTAGAFWAKASRFTSLAFDSNAATGSNSGTFFTYYYTGAAWVETASLTTLPVTQYNDITSGLVTLTNTRWTYYDVYLGVNDGDVRILYGQAQYLTQADATVAQLSSILPNEIGDISYQFIGRYVFQKNAASFANVLSAYASDLAAVGITDHNALANVQGGAANDYSHITAAQYTDLTDGSDSSLHYHLSDRIHARNCASLRV